MKKFFFFISFLTLGLAKGPFEVPLEKKIYLSNLDKGVLPEKPNLKDWFYVVKELEGRKIAFKMPQVPQQKVQGEEIGFQATYNKGKYQVLLMPVTETVKKLWEELCLKEELKQTKQGKLIEVKREKGVTRYLLHPKAFVILSVEGEVSSKEEKAFFTSLSVLTPKRR